MNSNLDQVMDALIWTGPRAMHVERVALPKLAPDEVLVEVDAAGICGSEISGYLGQSSMRTPPLVMGHEAAGTIVAGDATLSDGTPARAGEQVVINPLLTCGTCDRCAARLSNLCRRRQLIGAARPGAFARYVAVPGQLCTPLPAALPIAAAVWVEPLACAVRAVRHAAVQPGGTLLVLGAGPIGLCCVAAARSGGATTIITDLSDARLAAAKAWGASYTLKPAQLASEHGLAALAPGGADAVIDAVGVHGTRSQAVRSVVPGGRAVFIGLHDEESPLAANYLVRQEVALIGSFAYTVEDFATAFGLLAAGGIPEPMRWLDLRPLAAGPASFIELVEGTSNAVKIALVPR
jgi:threonine dehydrogenase-like Zn-dependent dehydrogenase